MKPASLNLTIYQGSTFVKPFQWKTGTPAAAVDITGYTARMHIRKKLKDTDYTLELTTDNERIVITDMLNGKFEIRLTAAETATLPVMTGMYDFEIIAADSETVYRLFEGSVTVDPEVTR